MPRIDPLQLLKCLSVLLSPEGGILSRDEVPRLVNLMTKFSKKLVSKSIYVLILKSTENSLVDMFMAEGGWTLIQTWIQDAVLLSNWILVKEILELLLVTPVDVERLKMNCLPKLIKSLSRREELDGVAALSDQVVQKWLTIVKGNSHAGATHPQPEAAPKPQTSAHVQVEKQTPITERKIESVDNRDNIESIKPATFYKSSESDNKIVAKEMVDSGSTSDEVAKEKGTVVPNEGEKTNKDVKKESHSKSSSSSSSSSSSRRDKDKDRHRSSSSHSSGKSKSSSRDKDRHHKYRSDRDKSDKDKSKSRDDKDKSRDKDKERRSSSSKSSSSKSSSSDKSRDKDRSKDKDRDQKSKESKEKQAEKDKDTLAKIKPPTIDKLGRIPKKTEEEKDKLKEEASRDEIRKPAFSILDKKTEERAKTVKVYNSKMRSTGLEEEVKPPPPRSALKKSASSVQLPTIPQKRPSPTRDLSSSSVPPEKKIKIDKFDIPERPGAIKLIPPKPKPMLQESDMFMDALTASATKKPAKRKRRPSQSKEVPSSPTTSNPSTTTVSTSPTTSLASPPIKHHIAPINFYQDTLTEETIETSEMKEDNGGNDKDIPSGENNDDTPASPSSNPGTPLNQVEAEDDDSSDDNLPLKMPKLNAQGLKSALLHSKKKGPKRSIQWRAEANLVEVRYFELDENERVNVTKTFTDMAKMEMTSEREALIMSRKPSVDDTMEPQIPWRFPVICEKPTPDPAVAGSKSLEKDIQFAREKSVLQALYFDKRRIPDSPEEPIPENHQMIDPIIIPLEDPESQEIDLKTTPWPEPKGLQLIEPQQLPPVFNQNMPYNPNFPMVPPHFAGMPPPQRFGPPGAPQMPPLAGNFGPPMMGPLNMMVPPTEMINQGYMVAPHEAYPGPEGYPGPPPFTGPPGPNMNLYGPAGNYNNYRGSSRGNFRRGGNNQQGGGWVRMNAPNNNNNWKRGGGRAGPNNNRVCKNITNHGYCRNGDNCQWFHPK